MLNRPEAAAPTASTIDPRRFKGTLIARGLTKSYKGRQVVWGVSIGVRAGEAVGLLGPNGAGKTTCFYMVTGLVPVDQGTIEIDGNDVTSLPMYRRARLGIGYLPQEASIFRGLTVEQNIRGILEVTEKNRKVREERLDELLEEFHISHLRKSASIALSGGERRRLEIARALASKPNFMLLDEPFAGVDPIAVSDIQHLVRQLTSRGIGVLVTDHNVRETLGLIDRAYIIHAGQVLTHGRPAEIVANPDVRRLYLGEGFTPLAGRARSRLCRRNSGSPIALDKQDPGQFVIGSAREAETALTGIGGEIDGAWSQTSATAVAIAGDDAAIAAVDPAAAVQPSRTRQFIDEEIERNPLLERAEAEDAPDEEAPHHEPSAEDGVDEWFEASDGIECPAHRRSARHIDRERLPRRARRIAALVSTSASESSSTSARPTGRVRHRRFARRQA